MSRPRPPHRRYVAAGSIRRGLALAAVVGAGVALTACAPAHPGAAAVVGDTRISTSALQAAAARLEGTSGAQQSEQSGGTAADLTRSTLSRLIGYQLLADGATLKKISVSEGEVQSEFSSLASQEGSDDQLYADADSNGIAKADLHDYLYYTLIEQKLESLLGKGQSSTDAQTALGDYLSSVAKSEGVKVNPRYGVWNEQTGSVDAGPGPASLSSPEASAAAPVESAPADSVPEDSAPASPETSPSAPASSPVASPSS